MRTIGERLIAAIIRSKLLSVSCPDAPGSGCLIVWSANAAEQLNELVERWPTHCRQCGDKLAGHEDVAPTPIDPGEGWRLLAKGEDPKLGDWVYGSTKVWRELEVGFISGQREGWFYRRRIEPTYRPFVNAAEYKPHRERWIINKPYGVVMRLSSYADDTDWKGLFERCEFEDGTPFGVEVQP